MGCRKPPKVNIETFMHEQIAMVAGVFEVKCCRWNSSQGSDKCVLQCRLASDTMSIAEVPMAKDLPAHDAPPKEQAVQVTAGAEEGSGAAVEAPGTVASEAKEDGGEEGDEGEEEGTPDPLIPDWVQVMARRDRFKLTMTDDEKWSEDPLNDEISHVSLRRCLAAHYDSAHARGSHGVEVGEALALCDEDALGVQTCVRSLLNLLRPLTFY